MEITITGDDLLLVILALLYGAASFQIGYTIGESKNKIIK